MVLIMDTLINTPTKITANITTDTTSQKQAQLAATNSPYIGRFAPSPSGQLHFGSLVSAVSSYCDAKAAQGKWLVRIEDLDPPREKIGAGTSILNTLESHGLMWDDSILYQSRRLEGYQEAFEQLKESIYPCSCTRQDLSAMNGHYNGHCRHLSLSVNTTASWRLNTNLHPHLLPLSEHFDDVFLGPKNHSLHSIGDFILKRKDALFSYQLAVVVDDLFQQITHIIRGQDLLDSTYWQQHLYLLLTTAKPPTHLSGRQLPQYGHTPLVLDVNKHKLSKHTKATPIEMAGSVENLIAACTFLGHKPPKEFTPTKERRTLAVNNKLQHCTEIIDWAIENWHRPNVPKHSSVAPTLADA